MHTYETMIGLEVHVELSTKTKIFCGCPTVFGAKINQQVCPVCMGFPGALPVLNRQVAEYALMVATALKCRIPECCLFDRKNYFYPDNPQNYQISQLYAPIGTNGVLEIETPEGTKEIHIHEMHMEEDAGKLIHDDTCGDTYVDYNRSGVPLLEIVTEPDFSNGEEVVAFLEKLRLLLQYLGVSDCRMQEGSLRVDVNLSVRPEGEEKLGVRTEMKNLNSLRSVLRAVEEEQRRQADVLRSGGVVLQETRRFDETTGTSYAMRLKETTEEYRYFPDPDLRPLWIDAAWRARVAERQPELRDEKVMRYQKIFGLPEYDAKILTSSRQMAKLFEDTTELCGEPKEVSNWLMTETMRLLRENGQDGEDLQLSPEGLAALIQLVKSGKINRTVAKEVFEKMFLEQAEPLEYIKEQGLFMEEDANALTDAVLAVIKEFPQSVRDYRNGKEKAIGFLIGQTMKKLGGKANPGKVTEILRKCLQIDA